MRVLSSSVLLAACAPAPAQREPVELVPGERLGPIALGMDQAALDGLGAIDDFEVHMRRGQVASVAIATDRLDTLRIGEHTFMIPIGGEAGVQLVTRHLAACVPERDDVRVTWSCRRPNGDGTRITFMRARPERLVVEVVGDL